jgi:hypothetical protein
MHHYGSPLANSYRPTTLVEVHFSAAGPAIPATGAARFQAQPSATPPHVLGRPHPKGFGYVMPPPR